MVQIRPWAPCGADVVLTEAMAGLRDWQHLPDALAEKLEQSVQAYKNADMHATIAALVAILVLILDQLNKTREANLQLIDAIYYAIEANLRLRKGIH